MSFILQEQKKETVKQSFAQVPKNIHPLKLARTIVGIKSPKRLYPPAELEVYSMKYM